MIKPPMQETIQRRAELLEEPGDAVLLSDAVCSECPDRTALGCLEGADKKIRTLKAFWGVVKMFKWFLGVENVIIVYILRLVDTVVATPS